MNQKPYWYRLHTNCHRFAALSVVYIFTVRYVYLPHMTPLHLWGISGWQAFHVQSDYHILTVCLDLAGIYFVRYKKILLLSQIYTCLGKKTNKQTKKTFCFCFFSSFSLFQCHIFIVAGHLEWPAYLNYNERDLYFMYISSLRFNQYQQKVHILRMLSDDYQESPLFQTLISTDKIKDK